ncbi:pyridoxamine 5'-phosphate oxidase family protein [Natronococcus wangiae]|uniref:pyridoxamine 5'-phosphate oxidase family protein n=1 Tax=Natronococcus wangiae TaxID=3068275 RepID=UPI0027402333|nr:pyridoxamine 5'-phosphate oxidase family protein [Natronococcus sp. AD5]
MTRSDTSAMTETEIADFLAREGTGVLSFALENESYSIPVSYGYDPDENVFYMQLEVSESSGKSRFIKATEKASFVVYNQIEGVWRSVVARGTLKPISVEQVDQEIVKGLQRADAPLAAIFEEDKNDLSFQIHRLAVHELNGRKANQ